MDVSLLAAAASHQVDQWMQSGESVQAPKRGMQETNKQKNSFLLRGQKVNEICIVGFAPAQYADIRRQYSVEIHKRKKKPKEGSRFLLRFNLQSSVPFKKIIRWANVCFVAHEAHATA